jgi:hypothetical protein
MIVFTILGVLTYWAAMYALGYGLGLYLDIRRGIQILCEPIDTTLVEIEMLLQTMPKRAGTGGTP